MALNFNLGFPFLNHFSTPRFSRFCEASSTNNNAALLSLLLGNRKQPKFLRPRRHRARASLSESEDDVVHDSVSEILGEESLTKVSVAKDAGEVLAMIAEKSRSSYGVVSVNDCRLILNAAIDLGNTDLALSVFYAMRSSFDQGDSI